MFGVLLLRDAQDVGRYVQEHPLGKEALAGVEGKLQRIVVVLKAKSPLVNFVIAGDKKKRKKGKK